ALGNGSGPGGDPFFRRRPSPIVAAAAGQDRIPGGFAERDGQDRQVTAIFGNSEAGDVSHGASRGLGLNVAGAEAEDLGKEQSDSAVLLRRAAHPHLHGVKRAGVADGERRVEVPEVLNRAYDDVARFLIVWVVLQ